MRVKYIKIAESKFLCLSRFPNFSANGSIKGIKQNFMDKKLYLYGKEKLKNDKKMVKTKRIAKKVKGKTYLF